MGPKPLVSILVNNYNYGRFVAAAIDSALSQTYDNIEVIVVDDGSVDESREILSRYAGRVRLLAKENGGQASAFNAGFAASRGEIICFLDSDDCYLPDKVSSVVEIFNRQPQAGWCFHRLGQFGEGIKPNLPIRVRSRFGLSDGRRATAAGKPPFLPTATSGMSFRRRTLEEILPMPELIRITSDNYLKFVALSISQGWIDSRRLSLQRIHGDNAYTNRDSGKVVRVFGRTGLVTGICLHERFPVLQPLGRSIFCNGLGTLWATGGIDTDCEHLVDSFLGSFAFATRSSMRLQAAYTSAKTLFSLAPGKRGFSVSRSMLSL
jgi:glycosyltransferase involved in cell wall biosynthesis